MHQRHKAKLMNKNRKQLLKSMQRLFSDLIFDLSKLFRFDLNYEAAVIITVGYSMNLITLWLVWFYIKFALC